MNYIYDIYLNFKNIPYEFYDWNKNDVITHIKKIPIFKVSVNNLEKIIKYNIKLDDKWYNLIRNKAEIFNSPKKFESYILITDSNNIIAIMFDNNGISIKRSFLMIDEELEILDDIDDLNEINIEFKTLKKVNYIIMTRKELKDEEFITKELKNISDDRLKYVYYDCFNKYESNISQIKRKIKSISKTSSTYKNLYDILKITSTSNKKMI